MKIITLTKDRFNDFALNHPYASFYQTSSYGDVMSHFGFIPNYLGFLDDAGNLVGASLILFKKAFFNYKYAYAPRGFLIDYKDFGQFRDFTKELKRLLLKQNFLFITIDPLIPCTKRNKNGEIISVNNNINDILSSLKQNNYIHYGFNNYFETLKPRWNAFIEYSETEEELFKKFDKLTRNKIKKAIRMGVEIIKDENNDIEKIYDYLKIKYNRRNLHYYNYLKESFKDNLEVYYNFLNTANMLKNAKSVYEQELAKNEYLNNKIMQHNHPQTINEKINSDKMLNKYKKELIEATRLAAENPNGLIIGGGIFIKHLRTINLLIEGYNPKYGRLNSNHLLRWHVIQKYRYENYDYFNLNAITGIFSTKNKLYGLNKSKLGFNAYAVEYIGEFNLIINDFIYRIYKLIKRNNKMLKK